MTHRLLSGVLFKTPYLHTVSIMISHFPSSFINIVCLYILYFCTFTSKSALISIYKGYCWIDIIFAHPDVETQQQPLGKSSVCDNSAYADTEENTDHAQEAMHTDNATAYETRGLGAIPHL